jgi:hypothetical protein
MFQDRTRIPDGLGRILAPGMGNDLFEGVADVNGRLKDLDLLAGYGRAPQAADQFVGLAAKHRAGNNLN